MQSIATTKQNVYFYFELAEEEFILSILLP